MTTGILHTHTLIVVLYLVQLLVKVVLMAAKKQDGLAKFAAKTKILHIVLSVLMLGTGIYLMIKSPNGTQPYIFVKLGLLLLSIPLGVVGMKRNSFPLLSVSFLLLVGAMAIAYLRPESLRSNMTSAVDESAENSAEVKAGQALYEQYCTLCHGGDGAAGFQGAKNLGESTLSDDEITTIIKQGKGMMPANPDLNNDQVAQLKAFVKYLRK